MDLLLGGYPSSRRAPWAGDQPASGLNGIMPPLVAALVRYVVVPLLGRRVLGSHTYRRVLLAAALIAGLAACLAVLALALLLRWLL